MRTDQTSLFESVQIDLTYVPVGVEGLGTVEHASYRAALGVVLAAPAPTEREAVRNLAIHLQALVRSNPARNGLTAFGQALVAATRYDLDELTAWLADRAEPPTLAAELDDSPTPRRGG